MAADYAKTNAATYASWLADDIWLVADAANGYASSSELDEAAASSQPVQPLGSANAPKPARHRLLEDATSGLRCSNAEPHANASNSNPVCSAVNAAVSAAAFTLREHGNRQARPASPAEPKHRDFTAKAC